MRVLLLLSACLLNSLLWGQVRQPVKWHFSAVQVSANEAHFVLTANVDEGWHIFSQNTAEGGPLPTTFTFEPSKDYKLIDRVQEESTRVDKFDSTFLIPVSWFEGKAVFVQRVKLLSPAAVIKGKVAFMACSEDQCLLPEVRKFSVEVKQNTVDKTGK